MSKLPVSASGSLQILGARFTSLARSSEVLYGFFCVGILCAVRDDANKGFRLSERQLVTPVQVVLWSLAD
jgi:hypothetical protein